MEARLVLIEHGRRAAAFDLVGSELVIGRDPSVDVVLDSALVSRRHAVLRALGDRHTLTDLGSSNGTAVNGAPLSRSVLLQPGDVIELGGEASLVYELGDEARRARPTGLWVGVLLLAGAIGGGAAWCLTRGPEIDPEALELAERGLAAARSGDAPAAKEHLQSAAGILYHEGSLDKVRRADVMRVAMERLGAELPGNVDLWSTFRRVLEDSRPPPRNTAETRTGCRLDRVATRDLEACLRERIERVMVELWQDPGEVPSDFHRKVGKQLRREHGFLSRSLERGRPLVPRLRRAFEEEKMPPLLHYLALIESGYNPDAVSPARAVGLWQFMPGTAKQYGLRVGDPDERRDVEKSTRAAVEYLKGLAFEFGGDALLLALAGYNRGENAVRRALKQLDNPFVDRSYWRLVERGLLPEETATYVPRFMAAAVAGEAGVPDRAALEAAGY